MLYKRWEEQDGIYTLYIITPHKREIGKVYNKEGRWLYSSELLGTLEQYLGSDSLENAKYDLEYLIKTYCEDEIRSLEEESEYYLEIFRGMG